MEYETPLGVTTPMPTDAVLGLPAGHPLRCALRVAVDRWRRVTFCGYVYTGYALTGRSRPIVFGQCPATFAAILGNTPEVERLLGLWARCHRQKLTSLSPADRIAVGVMARPPKTTKEAA